MEINLNLVEDSKYPPWLKEFYTSVGYSMFLAYHNKETSLRQGYILLDNAIEQLLISYKKSKINDNKNDYNNFHDLIKLTQKLLNGDQDTFNNILEFHNTRNLLYHKSVFISVSKARFKQYLDEACKVCDMMGFEKSLEHMTKEFDSVLANTFDIRDSDMADYRSEIENLIKDNFGITPGQYQGDFVLASPPGYTYPALENIRTIFLGNIAQEQEKVRVFEVIDSNNEEPFHHYFISKSNSSVWFAFIHCFWSKNWGDSIGNDIKGIRNLIKVHKSRVIYKKEYFPSERIIRAFAPSLHRSSNYHF